MLKKILLFIMPLLMMVAIVLKINGVNHIDLNDNYYRFMASVLQRNEAFTIAIPAIPLIPVMEASNGFLAILDAFISFVNQLVKIINVLTSMINIIINVLTFVLSIIVEFISNLKGIFYPA